jgi:hypothetical protein
MSMNLPAIIVAALAIFVFGWLWYGPLFGKAWAAEMKIPMDGKPPAGVMARGMILMLVGNLLLSYVFYSNAQAWQMVMPDASNLLFGFMGGFFIWLGFFLPQNLSKLAWESNSMRLFWINTVHAFLSLQIVAMIFSHWR